MAWGGVYICEFEYAYADVLRIYVFVCMDVGDIGRINEPDKSSENSRWKRFIFMSYVRHDFWH